jgi:hypothetical protein
MPLLLFDSALDYLVTIVAGHGYDVGGSGRQSDGGDDGVAGLSTPWILGAASVALVTAGILVWLNPGARKRLRSVAPMAAIAIVIAAPLVAWTASAGGNETDSLIVERWIGLKDVPELLVSLGEDDLNTLETTKGKNVVRVVCVGDEGEVVLTAEQDWPFPNEDGYDYPHIHQAASREQLLRADTCRLRGTSLVLEADVTGTLTP